LSIFTTTLELILSKIPNFRKPAASRHKAAAASQKKFLFLFRRIFWWHVQIRIVKKVFLLGFALSRGRRGFNADEVKQELFLREEKDFALPWLFLDFRHAGGCGRNARWNSSINNLTLTGSAIESGDEGVVGRGNRYNGVIPFTRHMSMEACCGKNPYTMWANSIPRSPLSFPKRYSISPDLRYMYISRLRWAEACPIRGLHVLMCAIGRQRQRSAR